MSFFDKLFGQSSNPWLNRGNDLKKECQIETLTEAITCYNKAIETDPQCVEAWYKKAHCYHLLRNEEEAIRCYDEALKINPNDAEIWYNKGNSLKILKQDTESQKCLNKAKEIDPAYKNFIHFQITGMAESTQIGPNKFVFPNLPPDPRKWSK